ncbi:MAG: hypothetical protein HYT03_01925 [Candidatus Harrisonbacteria bacterium]|nr:hypothetical protein [Candidatus Harrisonbacteria bacterium]
MKKTFPLSLSLLFAVLFLFLSINPARAASPTLLLSPPSGSFIVGSTFDLSILLDTKEQVVSGLEVELFFPQDKIQLSGPSIGQSLIQDWIVPPSFSNREGRIYFSGNMPSPGTTVSKGVVLTFTFRIIAPGSGEIRFGQNTRVFTSQSPSTDALGQTAPAFFNFNVAAPLGPQIFSSTHPDPNEWNRDSTIILSWDRNPLVEDFSYSFDQDSSGFPDAVSDTKANSVSFSDLESGIWYLHLRQKAQGVWSGVSHFAAKIDVSPPESFDIEVVPDARTSQKDIILQFAAFDKLSGLDHFELKIVNLTQDDQDEGSLFFEAFSPYALSNLDVGRYHIIIKAVDKVGNFREEFVTLSIVRPIYRFVGPDGVDLGRFLVPWKWVAAFLGSLALLIGAISLGLMRLHRGRIYYALRDDWKKLINSFRKPPTAVFLAIALFSGFLLPGIVNAASPPSISIAPPVYYPEEEIFYLSGTAEADSAVSLVFINENGEETLSVEVKSDKAGEWSIAKDLGLPPGKWQVKAGVAQGNSYLWSDPKTFNAVLTSSLLGVMGVSYAQASIFLSAIILLSLLFLTYFFFRVRGKVKNNISNLQN